ncbi:hypothetical protein AMECASPLE_037136, partial [Ameca splendens]
MENSRITQMNNGPEGSKELPPPQGETFNFMVIRLDQQNSEVPSGPSAQQHQTQLDSIFM